MYAWHTRRKTGRTCLCTECMHNTAVKSTIIFIIRFS